MSHHAPSRRQCLLHALLACGSPTALAVGAPPTRLAAAWTDAQGRHHVGLLRADAQDRMRVSHRIEVPTRAHALLPLPGGELLAVARRPGEWLLRWTPDAPRARAERWLWLPADRRLNGHQVLDGQGHLLGSETDLEHERGLVVQRDARTLAVRAEWPSHGLDPHALLPHPDGSLFVANGGIRADSERGRANATNDDMDSSLVQLSARSRALRGQWRLADPRLSIRHLALHAASGTVGAALQAEHADEVLRQQAPLLALLHEGPAGRRWLAVPGSGGLFGYAGDIAATTGGFALSAPRARRVLHSAADGSGLNTQAHPAPCALAVQGGHLWVGGAGLPGLRQDNHWAVWA